MKAFFNSIIKPKEKPTQPVPAAGNASTAAAASPAAAAALTPATPASATSSPPTAASASPNDALKAAPSSAAATSANAAPSNATPAAPAALTPDALLTPPPASATTLQADKKRARALLDDYIGVMGALFDHSLPLKKETEYFLEQFDEWVGRDPKTELPKAHAAARMINLELPIVREKGTLAMQEVNASVRDTIAISQAYLVASAAKDEARRDLSIASLSRVKTVQGQCEKELIEAKKAQHELYVQEFKALHDKYGRNMDGTFKAQPVGSSDATVTAVVTPAPTPAPAATTVVVDTPSSVASTSSSSEPAPPVAEPVGESTAAEVSSVPVASPTAAAKKQAIGGVKKGAKK